LSRALGRVVGAAVALALFAPISEASAATPTPQQGRGPLGGAAALDRVAGHLPAAAARNRMSAQQLRSILLHDRSARLDPSDQLLYVDEDTPAAAGAGTPVARAPFPHEQTFALHSRPGAARTIYLDFDGEVVQGTAWNTSSDVSSAPQPAFDSDGDPTTFSATERDLVQSVWQRVSEDYAPFEVDVTTAAPSADALQRTSSADTTYGTRILISPSAEAFSKLCKEQCGGVAYVGAFDALEPEHASHQPAWVFPQALYGDAKYIAEAASHEAGHNLGLQHDGTSTADYSDGHGAWSPIMGSGYGRPITQWSTGEYDGADNQQDDLAVIAGHGLPVRTDDHGDAAASATRLSTQATATGLISTRRDRDDFTFTSTCAGAVSVQARPVGTGADLDVRLRLISSGGQVVASADPVSGMNGYDTATGLAASLSAQAPAGTYVVEVDGVGAKDPFSTGYSDYASLGSYTLDLSACSDPAAAPASLAAPTGVVATAGNAAATVTWTAPTGDGASAVTGYRVRRYDAAGALQATDLLDASLRSTTVTGLVNGASYSFDVTAVNAVGPGTASERTRSVTPATVPGTPRIGSATAGTSGGAITARATWTPPASTGGSAVTGYVVRALRLSASGAVLGTTTSALQPAGARSLTMTLPQTGSYRFTVRAANATGLGARSARSNLVAGR